MDSDEEIQKRHTDYVIEEEKKELAENASLIKSFIEYCATKGLVLNETNFSYIYTIGIVATFPDIVSFLSSDFGKDKEGLVDFNCLKGLFEKKRFASGYFYCNEYMLMAHPYFRRGFHQSANFAPQFVNMFWGLNEPLIEPSIAIDYDRVRINVDNTMYMEKDTWFGAKFSKAIGDIKDGTVQLRPPSDIDSFLLGFCFADVYCLDIKWETKNGIKSFQAEEFKTENQLIQKNGIDYYPVRYIHAEFDLGKNYFRHFDGAIHLYTADEYFVRRDTDFNYNSKNLKQIKSSSEKLFKMNGEISADLWIEFTSHFLTGDPLVMEYFEGNYPDSVVDILTAVRKNKNN